MCLSARVLSARFWLAPVLIGAALTITACAAAAPSVPEGADPALDRGRTIWSNQCASCHGASGGGGRGVQLSDGKVLERYPFAAEQIELVLAGRGAMPAFAGRLSETDVEAVVRYTREVLNDEMPDAASE